MKKVYALVGAIAVGLVVWGCGSGGGSTTSASGETCTTGSDVVETITMINSPTVLSCTTNISPDAPDWIKNNFHCVTVKVCDSTYVFVTNNLPPYKSPYYTVASGKNETFDTSGWDGTTRAKNPNWISSQSITMTIPKTPTYDSAPDNTSGSGLDCLGLTTYGVCIFNNQAAPGDSLTTEFLTMDGGDGHPQSTGKYHHHTEPHYLSEDDDTLIGVMMDGYPVYGRKTQAGAYPTLDATTHTVSCTTTDFPSGTYCYHIDNGTTAGTNVDKYIIGTKFRGVPGSVQ